MKYIASIILTSLLFMVSSCDSTSPNPIEVNLDSTFTGRTSDFAFEFTKTLNKEEKNNNFFVSPLGLHMALGMLLNGADNASKDELIKTLKLDGLDMATINANYLELIDKLPQIDKLVTNKLANSIWQRKGFDVSEEYKNTLKSYFKAEVYEEDFSPSTITKINKWASDNTNAKIKEVLKEITGDQVMFLINALYFKGDWALQFDKKNTTDANFNGSNGSATVEMMSKRDTFALAEMDGFKALDLNYGNGKYAMRLLLPNSENPSELINTMNTQKWNEINAAMRVQKLDLKIPKFKMEYEKKLNETLITMGMPSLFSASADLSKISKPAGKLVVGFVKQNTYVAVDEEGTEAAAVTTIGIELTSVPNYPSFNVDKPFLFYIYEKSSGTIQFVGKILDLKK
jgi:serine protease inhibitor